MKLSICHNRNFHFWVVTGSSELISLFLKPRILWPTYVISHLSTLNFLCHFVTQSLSLLVLRPIYSSMYSALTLPTLSRCVSSASFSTSLLRPFSNQFLSLLRRINPRQNSTDNFSLYCHCAHMVEGLGGTWLWCWGMWYSARVYRVLQSCVVPYLRLHA